MKRYIIYDGRAANGDTDDAAVCEVCDSLQEAVANAPEYGGGCVIYSYDVQGNELVNEQLERIMPEPGETR